MVLNIPRFRCPIIVSSRRSVSFVPRFRFYSCLYYSSINSMLENTHATAKAQNVTDISKVSLLRISVLIVSNHKTDFAGK